MIDLRLRFGFTDIKNGDLTCIIVVQAKFADGRPVQMGVIVDGVEEVTNISSAEIEQPPDFGVVVATAYILGMAKLKGVVKVLLNIDRVISADTLDKITQTTFRSDNILEL